MAAVRRHWALVMAIPVLLLSLVFMVFQRGLDTKKAHADSAVNLPPASNQTAATRPAFSMQAVHQYQHIQTLRAELALGDQDLAALGVSSSTAHQIFTALKTFNTSSIEALGTADANYQSAKRLLQEAVRSINVGTSDNSIRASLPTLKQNVDAAVAQRAAVMAPLISQINNLLASDQQAMWQAARNNVALSRIPGAKSAPGAFRYAAGLTTSQVQQLDRAARRGGESGLQTAASQILNGEQAMAAQIAMSNKQQSMQGIATSETADLPTPRLVSTASPAATQPSPVQMPQ